jgi:hypothetical protein
MKRRSSLWMAAAIALLASGCGQGAAPAPEPPAQQAEAPAPAPKPAPSQSSNTTAQKPAAEPQLTKQTIAVYYTDGNISGLKKEEREIAFSDDIDKYKQAIALLQKPKEKGHDPLWQNFRYHSVAFKDGKLTIDADSRNQYNVGAAGEALAIDALRETLFQFPEVQQIVILEDGKPVDSLMGHIDVSEPLTR